MPVVVSSVEPEVFPVRAGLVQESHQIGPVVDHDVRVRLDHRPDPLAILLDGLALPGEGVEALGLQYGDRVVVRRERVTGRDMDLAPTGLEREREGRGLRLHVEDQGEGESLEGPLGLEPLADELEHRHMRPDPGDLLPAALQIPGH